MEYRPKTSFIITLNIVQYVEYSLHLFDQSCVCVCVCASVFKNGYILSRQLEKLLLSFINVFGT